MRCFSYIDDVIEGILALAEHPEAEGEVFNLGSTEATTIEDLAKIVNAITGSSSPIEFIPYDQAYETGF